MYRYDRKQLVVLTGNMSDKRQWLDIFDYLYLIYESDIYSFDPERFFAKECVSLTGIENPTTFDLVRFMVSNGYSLKFINPARDEGMYDYILLKDKNNN